MIENVWGYEIQHNKKEPLNRYEKTKIKDSLFLGFKSGVVKKSNLTIDWKVRDNNLDDSIAEELIEILSKQK